MLRSRSEPQPGDDYGVGFQPGKGRGSFLQALENKRSCHFTFARRASGWSAPGKGSGRLRNIS
jgi:hypothetical protein